MSVSYDTRISNPHRDDYWTCPGCYHDLGDVGRGRHSCPSCQRIINCTVEYEPACYSELVDMDEGLEN